MSNNIITGLRSITERLHINVDFWNPTRTNKTKRLRELSKVNLGLWHVPILVKPFSKGSLWVLVIFVVKNFKKCRPEIVFNAKTEFVKFELD